MPAKQPRRSRGVQLTAIGCDRLYQAKETLEAIEKDGERFTLEELNERTGLSLGTLTRVLNREGVVDKRTLTIMFRAFNLDLTPEDFSKPAPPPSEPNPLSEPFRHSANRYDWGSAIDVSQFQHRQAELQDLQRWIQTDRCRLIALLGLGGIGKTYLAIKLGQQLQTQFDRVLWRSLRYSPPLSLLLEDIVAFFTGQPAPGATLNQLGTVLQAERCLVILDNFESVLKAGDRAGVYRSGHEDYGELLNLLGKTNHQSCLLLTSRETPTEVATMAGNPAVRSLTLQGCSDISLSILHNRELIGSTHQFQQLCDRYSGVPLAIAMIATLIQDLFSGSVEQFFEQQTWTLSNLRELLDSQFERLDDLEQAIAFWLAIHQNPVSVVDLEADLIPSAPRPQILESLESLRQRSLIESQQGMFTLQPVVMDYVSGRLVDSACAVLNPLSLQAIPKQSCLHTHAFLNVQAIAQIHANQRSQLIQPLIDRLLKDRNRVQLTAHLHTLLSKAETDRTYWAGNLVNLLIQLQVDLRGQSFANLTLWQVDFRNVNLAHTYFRNTDLSWCRFSQAFCSVYAIAFSPDGKTLVTGHGDGELRQWFLDGRLRQQYQHAAAINTLAFADDDLVVGTFDGAVHLYDGTADLKPLRSLNLREDWIGALTVCPGDRVVVSSSDGTLKIWNYRTETLQHTLSTGAIASLSVSSLSVSQEGWLVCGDENGTIQLWHPSLKAPWQCELNHALVSVAISPDGTLVASVDTQQMQIWQRQGDRLQPLWQTPITSAWTMAFSPDSQTLAVTEGDTIQLFDAVTSCPLHTLYGHSGQVWSLTFDPSGILLASGSDEQIILWQVETGDIWRIWKTAAVAESPVLSAAFSQDAQVLASGDGHGDVRLWDCQTRQCIGTVSNHDAPVRSLAVSPKPVGKGFSSWFVASGSDRGIVRLWTVDARTDVAILNHPQGITALAFSDSGQWLASGSVDGSLQIWDIHHSRLQATLSGHSGRVLAIAFSTDGEWLATGSSDYVIRVWCLGQTTPVMTFSGHQGWVWSLAFSPNGQQLASGSDDHTVKIWDLQQQVCTTTLQGHQKLVWSVAFWPQSDSKTLRLVSGSLDQTITIWDLSRGQPMDRLEANTDLLWVIQPAGDRLMIAGTQGNTLQLWDMEQKQAGDRFTPQLLYERMDITQVRGLTPATIRNLERLGAIGENYAPQTAPPS